MLVLLPLLLQSDRLKLVQDHLNILNSLCSVLGLDVKHTAAEVHDSLADPERPSDISNNTIEKLAAAITNLREVKLQRMQKVINSLCEL